jgi:hypothetical protein
MTVKLFACAKTATHFADIVDVPVTRVLPETVIQPDSNSMNYWIHDVIHTETNLDNLFFNNFFKYNNNCMIVVLFHEPALLGQHSPITKQINYIIDHAPDDRVIFLLGTPQQLEYFKKIYPTVSNCMIFNYWEFFIRSFIEKTKAATHDPAHAKRFLYMNRRNYVNRLYMFGMLWQSESFRNNSYTSFNPSNYWGPVDGDVLLDALADRRIDDTIRNVFKNINLPQLPERYSSNNPFQYSMFDSRLSQAYADSSIDIIVESVVQSIDQKFFPTEKLFRAIGAGTPFIVYAQPEYYQNLKRLGYETYEEIFGETHDHIYDDFARARSMASTILRLSELDHKQFRKLVKQAHRIAKHNRDIFVKRTDLSTLSDGFPKLLDPLKDYIRFAQC